MIKYGVYKKQLIREIEVASFEQEGGLAKQLLKDSDSYFRSEKNLKKKKGK